MPDRRHPSARLRLSSLLLVGLALAFAGCASRPINPPLKEADRGYGYRAWSGNVPHAEPYEVAGETYSVE